MTARFSSVSSELNSWFSLAMQRDNKLTEMFLEDLMNFWKGWNEPLSLESLRVTGFGGKTAILPTVDLRFFWVPSIRDNESNC